LVTRRNVSSWSSAGDEGEDVPTDEPEDKGPPPDEGDEDDSFESKGAFVRRKNDSDYYHQYLY
jgi:hypothetical protein